MTAGEAHSAHGNACTYVILAHDEPRAVLRLASAILSEVPQSSIVVHYSAASGPFVAYEDPRIIMVDDPASVVWGTFSQTDMMLRAMDQIRRSGLPDEWIVFLSGQCYPARPLRDLEAMLTSSHADAMFWFKAIEPNDHTLRDRYLFTYRIVGEGPLPFPFSVRQIRGIVNRTQPFLRVKSMPRIAFVGTPRKRSVYGMVDAVYFGTAWLALSRKALQQIAGEVERRPELLDAYRDTISSEESFFHTVLLNARDLHVVNDDLHFMDWSGGLVPSPRTLSMRDLSSIERSGKWFARKINVREDDGLRDALDELRARS